MPKTKARLQDFQVKRDGEGKLIPIEAETEYGTVMVVPMTYGDSEAWAMKMKDVDTVSDGEVAKLFAKHIVDPDLSSVRGDDIKDNYKPLAIAEILKAIMKASGLEKEMDAVVGEDGTVRIDQKNG